MSCRRQEVEIDEEEDKVESNTAVYVDVRSHYSYVFMQNDHLSRAAASMISTATASIEWVCSEIVAGNRNLTRRQIIGKQRTLRAISPTAKMERFELKSMPSCEFQRGLRR